MNTENSSIENDSFLIFQRYSGYSLQVRWTNL